MTLEISSLSKEVVRVEISARAGGKTVNPSSATVEWAFLSTTANPSEGDWVTGTWDIDTASSRYQASIVLGPGGDKELSAGSYHTWVRITLTDETPVKRVGMVSVT